MLCDDHHEHDESSGESTSCSSRVRRANALVKVMIVTEVRYDACER